MSHIETLGNSIIRLLKAILYRTRVVMFFIFSQIWKVFKFILSYLKKITSRQTKKHPGGAFSLLLHIVIIVLLIGDISTLFHTPPKQVETISVTMKLPISDKTNVKPKKEDKKQPPKIKPLEKPKKPVKKVKKIAPEIKPISKPVNKPKNLQNPPKSTTKTKPAKKVTKFIPKPQSKPKRPKPAKPVERVKKPLLKDLTKPEANDKKMAKETKSSNFDPTLPLSMSEKDAIKYQIIDCWIIPAGARDIENVVVEVSIKYFKDGRLNGVPKLLNKRSDNAYRILSESVITAINKCNPLKDLPVDKYSRWKEIEFEFLPSEAF